MYRKINWLVGLLAMIVLIVVIVLALPGPRQSILTRADQLRIRVHYWLNPPEAAVFTPGEQNMLEEIVQATLRAFAVTPSPTANAAATATPPAAFTPTYAPSATVTQIPTPLPAAVEIPDVPYVDQHYGQNNCAPANLAMGLAFWGWEGKRETVSQLLKPFERDKNVMPYEMADYVNAQTSLRALVRFGGTQSLLKNLIANGFPVIVERGVYLRDLSGKVSWMGHYQLVYGYDDSKQIYQVKDSFEKNGARFTVTEDDLNRGWRSFNYAFLVVYPPEKEASLNLVLGEYADAAAADRASYELASAEIYTTEGQDLFFAWYNRGSSLVRLQDYLSAAQAYDEAFSVYADLPTDQRPWRVTWYQTGPYFAYYFTGRYADVLRLTDQTISAASDPFLEENFYWRARAKVALGDSSGAADDLRKSLEYHPDFAPSLEALADLGLTP